MKLKLTVSKIFWNVVETLYAKMPQNEVVKQLYECETRGDEIDYLSIETGENKKPLVSFLPASRETPQIGVGRHFLTSGRQTSALGKAIRKILQYEVSDKDLADFVEAVNLEFTANQFELKIVSGKDIVPYFLQENYMYFNGCENTELYKSCMRYAQSQDYLQFYIDNPNLKLVLALKDGKVAARALLFENITLKTKAVADAIGKSKKLTFLNRIYFTTPQSKLFLWDYGVKHYDILHAINKNGSDLFVTALNEVYSVQIEQVFENWKQKYFPYVDTLSYFCLKTKTLHNSKKGRYAEGGLLLHCTDGNFKRLTPNTPYLDDIRGQI